jgi:hypothetical protein
MTPVKQPRRDRALAAQSPGILLGAEIRRLRRERGLSQQALVRMIGLSAHSNLSDYETGRRLPPADIVGDFERVLHITDGHLHDLRARALADLADQACLHDGHRFPAGRADTTPGRSHMRGRSEGKGKRAIVAGAVGLALAPLIFSVLFTSGVHVSTTWTGLADGVDPRSAGCARRAVTIASAPIRLRSRISVTIEQWLSSGVIVGHVELQYSAACKSAWARLDLAPTISNRMPGSVYVYAIRPSDGTSTAFGTGRLTEAHGDMLMTGDGCISAGGSIRLRTGPETSAATRCVVVPP